MEEKKEGILELGVGKIFKYSSDSWACEVAGNHFMMPCCAELEGLDVLFLAHPGGETLEIQVVGPISGVADLA